MRVEDDEDVLKGSAPRPNEYITFTGKYVCTKPKSLGTMRGYFVPEKIER